MGVRHQLLFRLPPAVAELLKDGLLNPEVFSRLFSVAGEEGTPGTWQLHGAWCLLRSHQRWCGERDIPAGKGCLPKISSSRAVRLAGTF